LSDSGRASVFKRTKPTLHGPFTAKSEPVSVKQAKELTEHLIQLGERARAVRTPGGRDQRLGESGRTRSRAYHCNLDAMWHFLQRRVVSLPSRALAERFVCLLGFPKLFCGTTSNVRVMLACKPSIRSANCGFACVSRNAELLVVVHSKTHLNEAPS